MLTPTLLLSLLCISNPVDSSIDGCFVPNLKNVVSQRNDNEIVTANNKVANRQQIFYSCAKGYALNGVKSNTCIDNQWRSQFPYCASHVQLGALLVLCLFSVLLVILLYMIYRTRFAALRQPKHIWLLYSPAIENA